MRGGSASKLKKKATKTNGAANRTRTCDPVITNDVLYQLSYCGGPDAAFGEWAENACHLISGSARLGKKNAGVKRG